MPDYVKRFDRWIKRNTEYHVDGNLRKVEFNAPRSVGSGNRYQQFSGYKRGIPQTITLPSREGSGSITKKLVVDNNGWVTQETDFNGVTTNIGYDAVGRLKWVDYANDSVYGNWLDEVFSWDEFSNTPIRTVRRCVLSGGSCQSGTVQLTRTETYDSMLRLVKLSETNGVSTRYQNFDFDSDNNQIFSSYWSDSSNEDQGTFTNYNSFGRIIAVSTTGLGTVTHDYLSGNKVKVTDALGNETFTTYQAYGNPSYTQALLIESPEGVTTLQEINVFGDVTSITQSGPGRNGIGIVSQTEYRAYNSQHLLCKIKRNDVGTTVFSTNDLGEVVWQAQGVTGGGNTDCISNATVTNHSDSAKKVNFTYDNLGDIWRVNYANTATPNLNYTRDNNGNVLTLTSGTVKKAYTYNSLNLVESELLTVDSKSLSLDYHYASSGFLSGITYPNGDRVNFSPNSFGQSTAAIRQARNDRSSLTYASNAKYYPSGSIDTFNYGNGLVHKTTLNISRVPIRIQDSRASFTALSYNYTYDDNLNVKRIINNVNSAYSLTDLTYDGLGRLKSTTGGSGIGSSSVSYDGLGNITSY